LSAYGLAVCWGGEIEFDSAKDAANRLKHGVPLALGVAVLMNLIGRIEDDRHDYGRHDYGETRFNAFGLVNQRLHVRVHTMRGDVYRVISIRKASRREQRLWLS
jgi:uncharacterized protein